VLGEDSFGPSPQCQTLTLDDAVLEVLQATKVEPNASSSEAAHTSPGEVARDCPRMTTVRLLNDWFLFPTQSNAT